MNHKIANLQRNFQMQVVGHVDVSQIGYKVVLAHERGYDVDCVLGVDQGQICNILFRLNKTTREENAQGMLVFPVLVSKVKSLCTV